MLSRFLVLDTIWEAILRSTAHGLFIGMYCCTCIPVDMFLLMLGVAEHIFLKAILKECKTSHTHVLSIAKLFQCCTADSTPTLLSNGHKRFKSYCQLKKNVLVFGTHRIPNIYTKHLIPGATSYHWHCAQFTMCICI